MKITFDNIRLIILGIAVMMYVITFGFLFIFAAVGLNEAEKQQPHAFDGHKFMNYNTFNFLIKVMPIIGMVIMITFVLIVASIPNNKKLGVIK